MAPAPLVASEAALVRLAEALGARTVSGWSPAETAVLRHARTDAAAPAAALVRAVREAIADGRDPLGDTFTALRGAEERRQLGAVYTPLAIVEAMLAWAAQRAHDGPPPHRIVDPGTGSGRFLVAAGRRFVGVPLVGVELDPVAALLARAHLAAAGLAERAHVHAADYRTVALAPVAGPSYYLGNPPYVRHHAIASAWKTWLVEQARRLGLGASQLAGLHVSFFLQTALRARAGDAGAFITSAEWLDVNYGRLVRELFLGPLGGEGVLVVDAALRPFPDAATTAAITTFVVGAQPATVRLQRITTLDALHAPGALATGAAVHRERLAAAARWTPLFRAAPPSGEDFVELGELCRVHRGAVTGANAVWVTSGPVDLPESVLFASVTKARELFAAGEALTDTAPLRRVIDLPVDLDVFSGAERTAVTRFLRRARQRGAADGYIARHRAAWWAIGLRDAPPILATYMARRPPAFVRNVAGARYINIAHGLYPREAMPAATLDALASYLARSVTLDGGRTYAGGLTKFEPREMERLLVPKPDRIAAFLPPVSA